MDNRRLGYTKMRGGKPGQYIMSVSAASHYGTHRVTGSAGFLYEKDAFEFQVLRQSNNLSLFAFIEERRNGIFYFIGNRVFYTRILQIPLVSLYARLYMRL